MPDMSLSMSLDDRNDDLPKTLRNRSLRTSDEPMQTAASSMPVGQVAGAVVTDIKIPFWRLVVFLMKVALACIPALLIVAVLLWGIAEVTGALFPNLVKMKILIQVPQK
jgi:hypothetical protein